MKFFFPIRTGTLQRERTRIAAKRGRHLRRVMQLDAQIAALQNERNEHFAAASAYIDAENTLDLQSCAMIDVELLEDPHDKLREIVARNPEDFAEAYEHPNLEDAR